MINELVQKLKIRLRIIKKYKIKNKKIFKVKETDYEF